MSGGNAGADESDEQFARRLQAQEMGINLNLNMPLGLGRREDRADSNTPLINSLSNAANLTIIRDGNNNPTVINARLNELATSRATLFAILIVNLPQVIATIIILSYHWNDTTVW